MSSPFSLLDWLVIGLYVTLLFTGGWLFRPRQTEDTHDYFLAGGQVPAWMAAISVLSATQSAATFLGGPDYGFRNDYTYIAGNIGGLIGALFVAHYMIPRFYAIKATTVYELLETRFSRRAMRWAGGMFLIGRVFAGGARVYLAAIAVSMVMFASIDATGIVIAAALVMLAAFLFTFAGGLRSVILNDLLQFAIYLGAALATLIWLWTSIPASAADIVHGLANAPDGVNKLRLFDWSFDPAKPFAMPAIVFGLSLLYIASTGTDQDVTQRLLASPDAKIGSRGLMLSLVGTVPVVFMFITIGLLLHVVYQRPELMGGKTLELGTTFEGQKISTFMHYFLTQLPAGLRGLVTAGVFAAAIATTNSALNAMSSVMVQDFYRPWKEKRAQVGEHHYVQAGRWGMAIAGIAMFGFAVVSFYWQRASDKPLLEFALQVMVFAYAGLLGVYFTALFSSRGTTNSVIAALIAGFVAVACCQPYIAAALHLPEWLGKLAFPWQLCIGTAVATVVCNLPRGNR
ncbi:MAG: sodium:solute symporter [Novosphingobium sp.]|uniref:sodium:solute symporter n=1 Tax=Novosphingobium sp. TaxID=1874826 RepID=UPI00260CD527|nr:sodium:solute symporter [Novosphingobium sp.]MCP5385206.1 sodium:solute symporter [Novosphingobium sp.]